MPFIKATPKSAALKICLYGGAGAGKTLTALLLAEGLVKREGGRIAFVNTEPGGIDFYVEDVPARKVHPQGFDVDESFTRSVKQITADISRLDPKEHTVIVVDSMTHIWEACQESYKGKRTRQGDIPMSAWRHIKRPWRDLVALLTNCPQHVICCARSGSVYGENDEGKETVIGTKAKAEGEFMYELNHVFEMREVITDKKQLEGKIYAVTKKDRSGVLSAKAIAWPSYERICEPLLGVLSKEHRQVEDVDVTAQRDADAIEYEAAQRRAVSKAFTDKAIAQLTGAKTEEELIAMASEWGRPEVKAGFEPEDHKRLKEAYVSKQKELREKEVLGAAQ